MFSPRLNANSPRGEPAPVFRDARIFSRSRLLQSLSISEKSVPVIVRPLLLAVGAYYKGEAGSAYVATLNLGVYFAARFGRLKIDFVGRLPPTLLETC